MRKERSLAGRAALAVALMLGFYALALGLCATFGALAWSELHQPRPNGRLLVFAAVTIAVVAWSVWPRAVKLPDPGVRLVDVEQPALWRLVRQVAHAARQDPPAELFLVADVNAFVAERGSRLGFGGTRIMGIGLPLLQVLTVPQLQSVLAHEFGHFHGGDTRLGPFVYRTRDAIGRTVVNLHRAGSLLGKPFEWYGKLFLRSTFAISRAQELAADALAVRLVGLEPVRTSLRRVNEIAPLFDLFVHTELLPVLDRRVRPPLAAGFATFLESELARTHQAEAGEQAMQAKGNPYDSHPPLSQRLAAAAGVSEPGTAAAEGPSAIMLLDGVDALEARLLAFQTGDPKVASLPTARWDDVVGATVRASWERFAIEHGRRFPRLDVAQLAAQRAELARYGRLLAPGAPKEALPDLGATALGMLLGRALVRAGWTVESSLGNAAFAVRGTSRLDPIAVGRAVAAGELTEAAWADACAQHGIGALRLAGPDLVLG